MSNLTARAFSNVFYSPLGCSLAIKPQIGCYQCTAASDSNKHRFDVRVCGLLLCKDNKSYRFLLSRHDKSQFLSVPLKYSVVGEGFILKRFAG